MGSAERNGGARRKYQQTALREVKEETGARASIVKFIGKSQYRFSVPEGEVNKQVYWYLMRGEVTIANHNRKSILWIPDSISIMKRIICCAFRMRSRFWKKAYEEYQDLRKCNLWGSHKYF